VPCVFAAARLTQVLKRQHSCSEGAAATGEAGAGAAAAADAEPSLKRFCRPSALAAVQPPPKLLLPGHEAPFMAGGDPTLPSGPTAAAGGASAAGAAGSTVPAGWPTGFTPRVSLLCWWPGLGLAAASWTHARAAQPCAAPGRPPL
jgi:hypothetical protein